MNDNLPDPIFSEAAMYNNGGEAYNDILQNAAYNDILQNLCLQYQLNNDDLSVLTHTAYTRKYVFRDAQLFWWLRQMEQLQVCWDTQPFIHPLDPPPRYHPPIRPTIQSMIVVCQITSSE